MELEPRMSAASPAQVLLHDALHDVDVAALESKHDRECDVPTAVQETRVIPEPHSLSIDMASLA
jgi:hypothetical protein